MSDDQQAGAFLKVLHVELTAVMADGSRTIVRYAPDPDHPDQGLRVTLAAHEPTGPDLGEVPLGSPLVLRNPFLPERHTIEVRDVARVEIEHLVRAIPGR